MCGRWRADDERTVVCACARVSTRGRVSSPRTSSPPAPGSLSKRLGLGSHFNACGLARANRASADRTVAYVLRHVAFGTHVRATHDTETEKEQRERRMRKGEEEAEKEGERV